MWRSGILLAGLVMVASTPAGWALDLYLVRHAETLANTTKDYSVFNQRHFTEAGQQQIDALTAALHGRHFDVILVSPAYRAIRTILPHLEETGAVAEIWPELDECCWQSGTTEAASDVAVTGPSLMIEQDMRPYFMVRAGSDRAVGEAETYDESLGRVQRAADLIQTRFGNTDLTVLVVAHAHTGSRLVEMLLGQKPGAEDRYEFQNGAFALLHAEGTRFSLMGINVSPAAAAPNFPPAAAAEPAQPARK